MSEFHQLRYFLEVAEQESFRRAAAALNIAQSALSRHVKELEDRLGTVLLDRLPNGVRMTPAGQVFAVEARRGLEVLDRAGTRARRAAAGEIGRLALGMNDIAARNRRVARCLKAFTHANPGIQLDIVSMVSQEQVTALQGGKIDAGFMIERPEHAGLDHVCIENDPFWLALPIGHRLAARPTVPIGELVDEPFVSVSMTAYWLPQTRLLAQCRTFGLVPKIVQEASNDLMQLSFIAVGMGVGFVNASSALLAADDVVLRPVEGLTVTLGLDLAWMRQSALPSLHRFVALARSDCADAPP